MIVVVKKFIFIYRIVVSVSQVLQSQLKTLKLKAIGTSVSQNFGYVFFCYF